MDLITGEHLSHNHANMVNRSTSQPANVPYFNMNEMLQDHSEHLRKQKAMSNYFANMSMMGHTKPFFFPPPDLEMVESMGSLENSSKYFHSVMSTRMNKSINKGASLAEKSKYESSIHSSEDGIAIKQSHTVDHNEGDSIDNVSVESLKTTEENFLDVHKHGSENSDDHIKISESAKISPDDEPVQTQNAMTSISPTKAIEEENSNNLSVESYYILEDLTKEGLQKYLKDAMLCFNEKYSIEKSVMEDDIELIEPSIELLFKYCMYVIVTSKMEKEIPIIALIYLERLLQRTGVLVNETNWRRLILITFILASKIWDDDSLENEHFPKVMQDVSVKMVRSNYASCSHSFNLGEHSRANILGFSWLRSLC